MTYSLTPSGSSSLQLGIVTYESVDVNSQLFTQPSPGSPSANTVLIDLFGVERTISLEGVFITGTGGLTIKNFVDQFIGSSGVILGSQKGCSYVSDTFTDAITVIIMSFNYSYVSGDPTRVVYKINLQHGTVG